MRKISIILAACLLLAGCGLTSKKVSNTSSSTSSSRPTAKTHSFTFEALPTSVSELQALPDISMKDPYAVAAMTVAALTCYDKDRNACYAMLDYLKGPDDLTALEKSQLRDRLSGKAYKVLSFFDGSSPENSYTPKTPYKITVTHNDRSFDQDNYATLYLKSSGADSARPIKLRKKPSTGEWFLSEILFLADIKKPADQDPWQ